MLKKIVVFGATAVLGLTSLGFSQFIVHADTDTAKKGTSKVMYNGQEPVAPTDWGISVPQIINLSRKETVAEGDMTVAFGLAGVSIVDSEGNTFQDSTANRNFSVSGISVTNNPDQMQLINGNGQTVPLLAEVLPTNFDLDNPNLDKLSSNPQTIENLTFNSNASGNSKDSLTKALVFAAALGNKNDKSPSALMDPTLTYAGSINWTGTEVQ